MEGKPADVEAGKYVPEDDNQDKKSENSLHILRLPHLKDCVVGALRLPRDDCMTYMWFDEEWAGFEQQPLDKHKNVPQILNLHMSFSDISTHVCWMVIVRPKNNAHAGTVQCQLHYL